MNFTHLHVHTDYSLLDGLNRIPDLLTKIKDNGMNSVAITDHGVLYGVAEFWKTANDFNIKPIIGCEIYLSPKERTLRRTVDGIKYYHLILLAKNLKGYQNLVKLVSIGQLEGMYYRPRVDRETLKKYSQDLICCSSCLAGPISRHILRREEEKAVDWLQFLNSTFKNDFYLELQRNGYSVKDEVEKKFLNTLDESAKEMITKQIIVNNKLKIYSDQFKIPLIASADAHYLNKEDRDVQTVIFCIKDGKTLSDEDKRVGYLDTYIKTPAEMNKNFSDDKKVIENTMKIAEKIEEFSLKFERVQPKYFNLPQNTTSKQDLKNKTFLGAKKRFKKITDEIKKRLDYELMVIDKKGYNDYFLIVGDMMQHARKKGIVVGVRGSAAASLVSYCLDITNIDPIKWELYFERFLNLERPSPPDIDMDLQDDRREEIINYVKEQYGQENVAAISAMGSLQTKAAIRDVARVMGIDLKIADTLSKKVQVVFGKVFKIDKMLEIDPEFREIIESEPRFQRLAAYVRKIEGMSRHISTHACGYLITPKPIIEYMALQKDSRDKDKIITQMDGTWIDKLDFMKFDFLGLRTLTIIKNTLELIEKRHKKKIDLDKINENDPKAFDIFCKGDTVGVFQFESPPMQEHLRNLKPENLEDISFLAAAYRPGPMKFISGYIACKHGIKQPEYLIPELEPILKNTFGYPIYQEQLFAICKELGGFSLGEADVIRNALKKKQKEILDKKEPDFKKYFLKHFKYDKRIADQLWDQLTPFSDYGFNKAHSASYAMIAYWCAFLKAYYPIEFISSLMHSDLENSDRITLDIKEVKRMGYKVLPPDINESDVYFTIEKEKGIRFGLGAIKNVGSKICKEIINERNANGKFKNLDELISRIGSNKINKKVIESLIKAGALDKFGDRNALLNIISNVFNKVHSKLNAEKIGQTSLFGKTTEKKDVFVEKTPLPNIPSSSNNEKLIWEKELLGVYLSLHPLENYTALTLTDSIYSIQQAKAVEKEKRIKVLGMFTKIKTIYTKKTAQAMALIQIEDMNTKAEGVIFPRIYEKIRENIKESVPYIIIGSTNSRNGSLNLIIEDIINASDVKYKKKSIYIDISKEKNKDKLSNIKETIFKNPGDHTLIINYGNPIERKQITKKIKPTSELLEILNPYIYNS